MKKQFSIILLILPQINKFILGRIVALDYGRKRTGIAVTDPMKIIATSMPTVETSNLLSFLKDYFSKETIEKLVMGLPKQMDNSPSESMVYIEEFVTTFKKHFPDISVDYIDERFTSKLAVQAMVQGGVKKKDRRDKSLVDSVSAVIILQSYLESKSYNR